MERDDVAGDTIAAIATPPGRGGIGIVRISGPNMILSPPLVITREEIDHLVDILEASYAAVEAAR